DITEIKSMPDYLVNAFVAIEDKRFYQHDGIDGRGMARAFFNNIFSFSFKEGASTITQQLVKNTHLSGEKTLKRKIAEIKLAKELEKKYSKKQILEKYLNTIYFGNNSYGITSAAKNYFNKKPSELTVSESAILAGLIKAPAKYSPVQDINKCTERRNTVLKQMFEQKYISKNDYDNALNEQIIAKRKENFYDYSYLAKKEVDSILNNRLKFGSGYKIYTYYDKTIQKILESSAVKGYDYTAILTDNNSCVKGYVSTIGDKSRQIGSTIKPILVYAPAVEYDEISPITPILDEKTDFNGYKPSNYGNKYYGYVSASTALAKSLNVCAVKILDSTGIEKSKNFAKKAGIPLTDNDKYLNIALGSTEKGVKMSELVSAYNIFSNEGIYKKSSCIYKIIDKNGKVVYQDERNESRVCSKQTAFLMSKMLNETVETGTAKTLKSNYSLCAKTGTVGNDKGNSDALCVSYSPDLTLGYWVGNADGSLMDNSITGGTLPTKESNKIWEKINDYKKISDFNIPDGIVETFIDKLSYERLNRLELADENTPLRYKIKTYFKDGNLPKVFSKRFVRPKIYNAKLSVFNEGILIELCLTELCEARIYRTINGKKELLYDTINKDKNFFDNNLPDSGVYHYSIVPYYIYNNEIFYGDEVYLEKIAVSKENGDWWLKDILS
ncbi:MAG: transglycosylase domain-containing protein, partial [Clostridia bacterium]|nr:transglycosylase domain-containing protein [Clostridia bacterium]